MFKKKDKLGCHRKVIDTFYSQDLRLSFKARGLLGYYLSKPTGWKGQLFDACNNSEKDGITAVKSAMKELVSYGYARLQPYPRKAGKFQGKYYEFYGTPIQNEEIASNKKDQNLTGKSECSRESYLTPWMGGIRTQKK
jgi:hypothetical protein